MFGIYNRSVLRYIVLHRFALLNTVHICITCTVHRTVNSVEHFALAVAGFFVLLASFVVQRREYFLYGLKHKIAFTDVSTPNYICPFQNLSLGFILKIFLKFRKFQP